LSDALHEKLTQRFVDRRTSVLMRRLREKVMLEAMIASDGDVQVEGQHVGWLAGFRFTPDSTAEDLDGKAVRAAAQKALAAEIQRRAEKLSLADDGAFVLDAEGAIRWTGEVVAKLSASDDILKPKIILLADEQLTGGAREIVEARLTKWLNDQIDKHLGSLLALRNGDGLEGIARGIGFRLAEELGAIDRREIARRCQSAGAGSPRHLAQAWRALWRLRAVCPAAFESPHLPACLPRFGRCKMAAWISRACASCHSSTPPAARPFPSMKALTRVSIPLPAFRVCGRRAVRFDILERLADLIRPLVSFRVGQTQGRGARWRC
jgi:ATP-dependent RNA helicase SUPV3L1/SUV3